MRIALAYRADFATLFRGGVRGAPRDRRGTLHPPQWGPIKVVLSYTGPPTGGAGATRLRFDPGPRAALDVKGCQFVFDIGPNEACKVLVERMTADPGAAQNGVPFPCLLQRFGTPGGPRCAGLSHTILRVSVVDDTVSRYSYASHPLI